MTLTWDDPGDDSITGYVILRRLRYDDPSAIPGRRPLSKSEPASLAKLPAAPSVLETNAILLAQSIIERL